MYILVTFVGVHLALERTGQGLVTGMATVVAPVVLLVTLVVTRVELLQSSSRPSG
jgi:hypothetical protein